MSDFDAEAERKRLREKYEAEEEDRKRTQQMSELLLKGATMTNRHCGECGSPIFRYEEQDFCPNCQRTTEGESENGTKPDAGASADAANADETTGIDAGADAEASTRGTDDAANGSGTAGTDARADAAKGSGTTGTDARADAEASTQGTDDAASNGVGGADVAGGPGRGQDVDRTAVEASIAADRAAAESTAGGDGPAPTRKAARESLLAALTRHARSAADTDEPRRATEHLEAARTAAAALDELDGS